MFRALLQKLFGQCKELFTEKQKAIYGYWNGNKTIHIDPMVLSKGLKDIGPALSRDLKVSSSISKDASKFHDKAVNRIQALFRLSDLEQGGLSEIETFALLDHFMLYQEAVRKEFESLSDQIHGDLGSFRAFMRRMPTYREYYGLWLNRKREFFRRAAVVAYGAAIAWGNCNPELEYYRAITDGEGEALLLKARQEALRNQS